MKVALALALCSAEHSELTLTLRIAEGMQGKCHMGKTFLSHSKLSQFCQDRLVPLADLCSVNTQLADSACLRKLTVAGKEVKNMEVEIGSLRRCWDDTGHI